MQSVCGCQTTGIEQCKGDRLGENTVVARRTFCSVPHHPRIIAFSGKRQFSMLFTPPVKKVLIVYINMGTDCRLHVLRQDKALWLSKLLASRLAFSKFAFMGSLGVTEFKWSSCNDERRTGASLSAACEAITRHSMAADRSLRHIEGLDGPT